MLNWILLLGTITCKQFWTKGCTNGWKSIKLTLIEQSDEPIPRISFVSCTYKQATARHFRAVEKDSLKLTIRISVVITLLIKLRSLWDRSLILHTVNSENGVVSVYSRIIHSTKQTTNWIKSRTAYKPRQIRKIKVTQSSGTYAPAPKKGRQEARLERR